MLQRFLSFFYPHFSNIFDSGTHHLNLQLIKFHYTTRHQPIVQLPASRQHVMSNHITINDINMQVFLQNQITFCAKFFSSFASKGGLSMTTESFPEYFSCSLNRSLSSSQYVISLSNLSALSTCVEIIHTQKQLLQLFVQNCPLVRC